MTSKLLLAAALVAATACPALAGDHFHHVHAFRNGNYFVPGGNFSTVQPAASARSETIVNVTQPAVPQYTQAAETNSRDLNIRYTDVPYHLFVPGSIAHIIQVPGPTSEAERAERARLDAKWVEYCEPKIKVDDLGVGRYQYSHAGCEFGRSAD